MARKINQKGPYLEFHCPGCLYEHCVDVRRWTWNSSLEKPSFQPSVKHTNGDGKICHFYVEEGKIRFCNDCTAHKLGGQKIELPDWETTKEEKPMATKKPLEIGDRVIIRAAHLNGVAAVVLDDHFFQSQKQYVCRITSSEHPSGHSQYGTLVMFGADELEAVETPKQEDGPAREVTL